jgi:SET domain-containing protein
MPSTRSAPSAPKSSPRKPFVLRRSKIQGTGAFATRFIPKDARIIEYAGERITNAEADRRYDDEAMPRHHTFLFELNSRVCIDAGRKGNEAKYINHSCEPNCEARAVGQKIYIFALRDIQAGEELTYDYAYEIQVKPSAADRKFYACRCGAPTCRKTILRPVEKKKRRAKKRTGKTRTQTKTQSRSRSRSRSRTRSAILNG